MQQKSSDVNLNNNMAKMAGVFLVTMSLTTGDISERKDTSSNRRKLYASVQFK